MAKHPAIKQFYNSKEWKTFRLNLINDRGNRCESCKEIIAKSSHLTGHHIVELTPDNVHDLNISLNPDKIKLVCFDCHNSIHERFDYIHKLDKKVYLVYGPPLSGKTTYVKQRKDRGDIVVDLDRLYEAMTLLPRYDKPNHLFANVMQVHSQIIDNIKTRYGKWNNAWIIGGYADRYKRNRVAQEVGAELIYCDVSKEECLTRLDNDTERNHFHKEWTDYIEKWFESYTT